jgi:Flp pilus assembly protein TadB
MELENNENASDELWRKFHRHHIQEETNDDKGRFYQVRQLLNLFFIILAIAGMIIWYVYSPQLGGITLISAVAFKFMELTLRLMKL